MTCSGDLSAREGGDGEASDPVLPPGSAGAGLNPARDSPRATQINLVLVSGVPNRNHPWLTSVLWN